MVGAIPYYKTEVAGLFMLWIWDQMEVSGLLILTIINQYTDTCSGLGNKSQRIRGWQTRCEQDLGISVSF